VFTIAVSAHLERERIQLGHEIQDGIAEPTSLPQNYFNNIASPNQKFRYLLVWKLVSRLHVRLGHRYHKFSTSFHKMNLMAPKRAD